MRSFGLFWEIASFLIVLSYGFAAVSSSAKPIDGPIFGERFEE